MDNKLADKDTKKNNITSGTKAKITYDAKGLVTKGEDLTVDDLPYGIPAKKLSDFNRLNGVTKFHMENMIPFKVTLQPF